MTSYQGTVGDEKADLSRPSTQARPPSTSPITIMAQARRTLRPPRSMTPWLLPSQTLGAPAAAGTADANTKSMTSYQGTVGDEKADLTTKYAGQTAVDFTYYYYGASKKNAATAAVNDAMSLQVKTLGAPAAAGTADANTKSMTSYQGTVGDEKADLTTKYAGQTAVDFTYYYYGASKKNAATAAVNDARHSPRSRRPWAHPPLQAPLTPIQNP